jgi:hypothetical protein
MYGYVYVSHKSHHFSKDSSIYVDELKLLNINIDRCCSPHFNKFVGILVDNITPPNKENENINNSVVLSKKYINKLYIPTFNNIIDIMVNIYIKGCYHKRQRPDYIKDEINELKNANHISQPFITFVPRRCNCCSY